MKEVLKVQLALNGAGKGLNVAFARNSDRDYLVRSEKRPGPRPGSGGQSPRRKNRRRKKLNIPYVFFTFLFLLLLYPIGLIFLWVRKIPWKWTTKMGVTLVFAMASVVMISFALTMPLKNVQLQDLQTKGRAALANAGTRMAENWEKSDITPERVWQNTQDIAGNSVLAIQNAVVKGIPALIESTGDVGGNARQIAQHIGNIVKDGARELMYKANIIPTPAPTVEPTPEPTSEPTPVPTPVPTVTPTPSPAADARLVAWVVGDEKTYHLDKNCTRILGEPTSTTILDATAANLTPCELCANPEQSEQREPEPSPSVEATPTATDEPIPSAQAKAIDPTTAPANAPSLPGVSPSPSPDPMSAASTPTATPGATPVPTPTATPAPLPSIKPVSDVTVYYMNGSTYYHATANCGGMEGAPAHTLAEGIAAGKKPCPWGCKDKLPTEDALKAENAVWVDEKQVFHITNDCDAIEGATTVMAMQQAMLEDGDEGCAKCGADAYVKAIKSPTNTPIPAAPIS